jgi:hypothetical protein
MHIAAGLPIIHRPVRLKFVGELRAVLRRDLPQQYLDLIHTMSAELLRDPASNRATTRMYPSLS